MSLPTYITAGTASAGASTLTPNMPSHQTDDILLLVVQSANETISLSSAQGFVETASSPQGTGTAATAGSTRIATFWCRATSGSMTAPTIADAGDHVRGQIYVIRGVKTTGDPWNASSGGVLASASTAVSVPGATTTRDDSMVVVVIGHGIDSTGAKVSGYSNSDLTANGGERQDAGSAFQLGGSWSFYTGDKATAGTYGATTATLTEASLQAFITLAFNGILPSATGSGTPTETLSAVGDGDATMTPDAGGGDATGSGTPTETLSATGSGTATQTFTGSGAPTETLSATGSGTASQKFTGSGSPTETLVAAGDGDATNTPDDSTGSGTPTETLGATGSGVAVQTFTGSGSPTETLSATGDGDGTMSNPPAGDPEAPVYVLSGVPAAASGSQTVNVPAHQEGDILLLVVQSANQTISLSTASGFVETASSPQGVGTAGAAGATRLATYWVRATSSSMAAPVVADAGDHTRAQIYVIRGCRASGNPWNATAGDTLASASASVTAPGLTTTVANCMVVVLIGHGIDSTGAKVSAYANSSLTANGGEREDQGSQFALGGSWAIWTGIKDAAGDVDPTTATLTEASLQARIVLAFEGVVPEDVSGATGAPVVTLGVAAAGEGYVNATVIAVGDNWATKVSAATTGTTFVVDPGVHRFATCAPKASQKFIGRGPRVAILRGARELTGWASDGAGHFFVGGQTQQNTNFNPNYNCVVGHDGCYLPEQLWVDDVLYERKTSLNDMDATPNSWYFDYAADRIYLSDDPGAALVETSVTVQAIASSAAGVTVKNLVIEKYACAAQVAALSSAQSWLLENNEVRHNHGVGMKVGGNSIARNNYIHHQGQLGMSGAGVNVLIEDNEIAFNNTAYFGGGQFAECGATKFVQTTGLIVRNNYVHDNVGPGIWPDINNDDVLIEDNLVEDNTWRGIFHEISYSAVIRNNICRRNGLAAPGAIPQYEGAGILVSNSPNVEVYGNLCEDNRAGIMGLETARADNPSALGPHHQTNLYVHDNTIIQSTGYAGGIPDLDGSADPYSVASNNVWENNTYVIGPAVLFRWQNSNLTFAQWQAAGQDAVSGSPDNSTGVGTPTATLSADGTGVATQTFSGSGAPTVTLSSNISGVGSQQFNGSGAVTVALTATVEGRALQADVTGLGAPEYALVASATGEGGPVQDEYFASGAPEVRLPVSASSVATQTFSGSAAITSTLVATAVGAAEQEAWPGPFIIGVTAPVASTASREVSWPGSVAEEEESLIQPGDIGILFIGTKNEPATLVAGTINPDGASSGFTTLANAVAAAVGTAGNASAVRLDVRWARATSHYMRSVLINDPGQVVVAAMVVIRGAVETGTPFDVTNTGTLSPASTALSLMGLTPLTANSLILQAAYHGVDADTNDAVTGEANSSLPALTEVFDRCFSLGPTGSGLVLVTGEKRLTTAVSATTATLAQSVRAAMVSLAITPSLLPTQIEGSGAATKTLSASAAGAGTSSPDSAATGAAVATLVGAGSGVATLTFTGSGASDKRLGVVIEAFATSTPNTGVAAITHTLVVTARGRAFSQGIPVEPEPEPPTPGHGQGRKPRKPRRLLLPEEEPEQPKIRRTRPATMPAPVPEAQALPDSMEVPAFEAITFDPSLWMQLSGPPVRPQTPVVTQQDIAEEERFLAQLLDLI